MAEQDKAKKLEEKIRKSIEKVETLLGRKLTGNEIATLKENATKKKTSGNKKELASKAWELLNNAWTNQTGYGVAVEIVQARLPKLSRKVLKAYIEKLEKAQPAKK